MEYTQVVDADVDRYNILADFQSIRVVDSSGDFVANLASQMVTEDSAVNDAPKQKKQKHEVDFTIDSPLLIS